MIACSAQFTPGLSRTCGGSGRMTPRQSEDQAGTNKVMHGT